MADYLQTNLTDIASNHQAYSKSSSMLHREKSEKEIQKTAEDFVSLFYRQFLEVMMPSDKPDPIFGKSNGQKYFNEMVVDEYAKIMSKSPNNQLTNTIKMQLLKMKGASNA